MENPTGNPPLFPPAALAPFLANDVLILDASQPYDADAFLNVELRITEVLGAEDAAMGGRALPTNVVDTILSATVGPDTVPFGTDWDCITENDVEFPGEFPFLAPPTVE